ncbi:hypothetical protein [Psychroflexus tropicus]|uniref:hypothetical protein n=1 Tax=Psychroflexus tropicus TaxID=197345 RepID=UPI00037C4901|nr:hypothetical protein [Psychroflexus tropicus]
MTTKERLHKINEYFLIPILFVTGTFCLMGLIYFVNEYFKSEDYFKDYFQFGIKDIESYKSKMLNFVSILTGTLLLKAIIIKY